MKKIFFSILLVGLFSSQAMANEFCTIVMTKSSRVFVHDGSEVNFIECTGGAEKEVPAFIEKGRVYRDMSIYKGLSVVSKMMEDAGWSLVTLGPAATTNYHHVLIFKK